MQKSPREETPPITPVPGSPSGGSLAPSIGAHVCVDSDHDMVSSEDAVNSLGNGPGKCRMRSKRRLHVVDVETGLPSPSNAQKSHAAGTSGDFFHREGRFSLLQTQEENNSDAGQPPNSNADDIPDDDDQASSYNKIRTW